MRRTSLWMMVLMLSMASMTSLVRADEQVTISAKSTDISEQLDLRTVATLFAESKDLEEFEQKLNNPETAFSNLDLNGDGQVDYLRVVESSTGSQHLILIQAVLAKDIFQDVATLYVEKDEATSQVSLQVIGDSYIYGENYIIEPVFYVRPVIYDWFWGPHWYCWHSPFYWDYWPGWWRPYYCCTHVVYVDRCRCYNQRSCRASYRTGREVRSGARQMVQSSGSSRRDMATARPEGSFSSRNTGVRNAQEMRTASQRGTAQPMSQRSMSSSIASSRSSATTVTTSGRSADRTATTSTRSAASTTTSSRSSVSTSTRSTSTPSTSSSRSSVASTTPSRSSVSTSTRSSYTPSSTSARSSSFSGGSSYSGSSRSSYSGGGYSGGGYSGGGYSGGSSRGGGSSYSGGGGGSSRR